MVKSGKVTNLKVVKNKSKDSSKVFVENAKMKDIMSCLTSYKKKQEFWGGYIFTNKIECSNFFKFFEKDDYSEIIINNSI